MHNVISASFYFILKKKDGKGITHVFPLLWFSLVWHWLHSKVEFGIKCKEDNILSLKAQWCMTVDYCMHMLSLCPWVPP